LHLEPCSYTLISRSPTDAMAIITIRNQALDINPPAGAQFLTEHGSDWLWTVFAIYALSFLVILGLSLKPKAGEKIFHYLYTIALLVGTIAYFAMASDLGFTVIETSNTLSKGDSRQIFFGKYINWVVSFPAIVLSLGLLSGISWASIIFNIFLSWTWIVSYLISAYTATNYKWGFFAFGTVAWIVLAVNTLFYGLASAKRVGVSRDYLLLAGWLNFMWLLYPIAFGLSDGGNKITVTAGFIFFGILDILTLIVISFATVVLSSKWDFGKLNLHFTQYGRVAQGADLPEKAPAPAAAAGVVGEQAA
jgi:bacteriorhodopsin